MKFRHRNRHTNDTYNVASVICSLFDSKALFVCFLFIYQEKYREIRYPSVFFFPISFRFTEKKRAELQIAGY